MALINLRNALMAGKRLPYDAEVEYLESTGTQYINTGILPANNMSFDCAMMFTELTSGDHAVLDSRSSGGTRFQMAHTYANKWTVAIGGSYDANGLAVSTNTFYQLHGEASNGQTLTLFANGSQVATLTATGGISTIPIYALARNLGANVDAYSKARIYSLKIYVNGALVQDLIPVRKGTVGYLYDRVSGKLFGNAGTGDFQYGQDVVPVEYIESTGTQYIETGVTLSASTQFKVDICPTYSTGDRKYLGSDAASFGLCQLNGKWRLRVYGWNLTSIDVVTDSFTTVEKNTNGWFINGTNVYADWYPRAAVPFLCFAWLASNNTIETASALCKISHLEITDNAPLVRSFLSVRVGTEGAMMDVLTRRIYRNAGTGAFGYGNDLKYPIPAE